MLDASHFDFVVVGGGSAGAVVAGRLSENPANRVCLVEAGRNNDSWRIRMPLALISLMGNPRFDWCYESAPHRHLNHKRVTIPRGKTLGGSGSINSMVYIRGRPSDYDAWAQLGCHGWDWETVRDRFVRQECNNRLGDDALHGATGPLHVQDLPSPHRAINNFVAAGRALGIPSNSDFNGPTQEGLGNYQTTMCNGRRWSAADAYLESSKARPNLTVVTNAEATHIEFNERHACAVNVVLNGTAMRLGIDKELVLTAGAIGSPALLLRSGVGPAEELSKLEIPIVADLAGVGANLHDHPAIGMHYSGGNIGYALSWSTALQNLWAPWRYVFTKSGLFSSNTVEGGGFARTDVSLPEPDVQFHFIPARLGHEGSSLVWGRGYYSDVCLLKPKSRGRLTLVSKDPHQPPVIDLNLLSDEADRKVFLRGTKLLRKLLARPELSGGKAVELVPGPAVSTDDELWDFISQRLGTAYHPVGTCRMGDTDDKMTVVDSQLSIIGLANVRVADASIMPEIVAGNTNAPTMMIADAAADFILAAN